MERRDFLRNTVLLSLGLQASCSVLNLLSGNDKPQTKGKVILGFVATSGNSLVRVLNWDDYRFEDIPVQAHLQHSFVLNPLNKDELYIFEMYGNCIRLNLSTGESIRMDLEREKTVLNGHGVLTADGSTLYTTEFNADGSQRFLVARDPRTLQKLELYTNAEPDHFLSHVPNSSLIAFGSTSVKTGKTGIQLFDTSTKTLRPLIETSPNIPTHFAAVSEKTIYAATNSQGYASSQSKGIPGFSPSNSALTNSMAHSMIKKPEIVPSATLAIDLSDNSVSKLSKEDLSVNGFYTIQQNSTGRILTSNMAISTILVWDSGEVIARIPSTNASNLIISEDQKEFMSLALKKGFITVYSLEDFREIKKIQFPDLPISAVNNFA